MNTLKKFKVVAFIVSLGLVPSVFGQRGSDSSQYSEFKRVDQPSVTFTVDSKIPCLVKRDPRVNRIDSLLCGTYDDQLQSVRAIKKSQELKNLSVLRHMMNHADWFKKWDEKFPGWRSNNQSVLAGLLEDVLQISGLMSDEPYQGKVLVDEYNQSLPMKWVLRNTDDLKGIRSYLEGNITPGAEKPLLLLMFLDQNAVLDASDSEFLSNHFHLLNPEDAVVKNFFEKSDDFVAKIKEATVKAEYIDKRGLGEMFLRNFEKSHKKFKIRGLAVKVSLIIAGLVTASMISELTKDMLYKPFKSKVQKKLNDCYQSTREFLGYPKAS